MRRIRRVMTILLMVILLLAVSNSIYAASLDDFIVTFSDVNVDEEKGLVSVKYHWDWNEIQKLKSLDEIQFTWNSQTTNLKPVEVSVSVDYVDIKTGEYAKTLTGEVTTHRWEEALEVSFANTVASNGTKLAVKGGTVDITLEVTEGSPNDVEVKLNANYVKGKMFHGNGLSSRTSEESQITTGVVLKRAGAEEQYEIRSDGYRKSPTVMAVLAATVIFVAVAVIIAKRAGKKMILVPLIMIFAVIPVILKGWDWVINTFYVPDQPEFEEHELYLDPSSLQGELSSKEMLDILHTIQPEDIGEIRIVHSGDCDIDLGYLCRISEESNSELFREIVNDFFGEDKNYQATEDMTDIRYKNYTFYMTICDHSGFEIMTLFYHYPGVIQWNGQFFTPKELISDQAVEETIFWSYQNNSN